MAYKISSVGPGLITGLLSGSLLERYGRKLYLLPPLVGSMLSSLILMCSRLVNDGFALLCLIILAGLLRGLSGKYTIVFTALQSYINDSSSTENRTGKSGILWGLHFLGILTGSLIVGILLDILKKHEIFLVVLILTGICVLMVIFCFKEDFKNEPGEDVEKPGSPGNMMNNNYHGDQNKKIKNGKEKSYFSGGLRIIESLKCLFRHREGNARQHICIIFLLNTLQSMCRSSMEIVTVLYVKQGPLSWPDSWYGFLMAVNGASIAVILLFLLPFASNVLKIKDINMILLSLVPYFLGYTGLTLVHNTVAIFLSVMMTATIGITIASGRSLISKLIQNEETGNIFSLLATCEMVANIIGGSIYTFLYPLTSGFYPSLIYAEIALPFFIAYIVAIFLTWDLHGDTSSKSYLGSVDEKGSEKAPLLNAKDKQEDNVDDNVLN